MKSRRRPTQTDVAQQAGVSQAMVSYVLNGNTNVTIPDDTRQRIWDAIDQLGYVPNKAARILRTSETRTVACVVPDMTNPFHTVFARGVQQVAQEHDYEFILYNTDRSAAMERSSLSFLQQGRVDGVIMTLLHLSAHDLLPLLEKDIAVVAQGPNVMPTQVEEYPLDSLHVNDTDAAESAVSYLVEQGHRRIALIAGEPGTPPRIQRERGYRKALEKHDLSIDEGLILDGDFKEEGGYQSMKSLLELDNPVSAVFAASDLMAIGALLATKEAGLNVPTDVAIFGFDNIPIARLVSPPLSTVAQFQMQMGHRAAELLFDRLSEEAPETGLREEMPYELIIRESA